MSIEVGAWTMALNGSLDIQRTRQGWCRKLNAYYYL